VVRIKPPKVPKPEPPPEGYVISVRTENGFDIIKVVTRPPKKKKRNKENTY